MLQICPFKKMAHRHYHESPDNGTHLNHLLWLSSSTFWLHWDSGSAPCQCSSSSASFLHLCCPSRLGAMSEMILSPTSSSSSQTAWRCMPTQYRDFTKHCWMTSLRSERLLLPNDNLMISLYKFPDLKDTRPETFEAIRPSMTCHIWWKEYI